MKESAMWSRLKVHLPGSFDKFSDRWKIGVPDVIGCVPGRGVAFELKQSDIRTGIRVSYRPGQVRWLRYWKNYGGVALTVVSVGLEIWVFDIRFAEDLEEGRDFKWAREKSIKTSREWKEIADSIISHRPLRSQRMVD